MTPMADTTAPERKISRVSALRASRDGGQARRDGEHVTDCPYSTEGDLTERFLARHWLRGYAAQLQTEQ
jgi:hypothetical protein